MALVTPVKKPDVFMHCLPSMQRAKIFQSGKIHISTDVTTDLPAFSAGGTVTTRNFICKQSGEI